MSDGRMIRAFVALELPETARRALAALQNRLKEELASVRWVGPAGIHLTLKFLGDISEDRVDPIGGALDEAMRGKGPLKLGIQGLGVFPGVRKARVVWAGLCGETAALFALQEAVADALETVGFPREKRPFRAHLTLGRFKKSPKPPELVTALERCGAYAPCDLPVDKVVLYRSELRPQGAKYTPLVQFPLAGD